MVSNKGNKGNKQKGSSILLILTISMVMITLVGVMLSAMLFTAKANGVEKKDDDLLYAAEGGAEYGQARFYKDDVILNSIPTVGDRTISVEIPQLVTSVIQKVEFQCERIATDIVSITSTAEGVNGDIKKITSKYILTGSGGASIYENSLAANKIEAVLAGGRESIDFRATKIAYGNSKNIEVWDIAPDPDVKLDNSGLAYPDFNDSMTRYPIPTNFKDMISEPEVRVDIPFGGNLSSAIKNKAMTSSSLKWEEFTLNHVPIGGGSVSTTPNKITICYSNADNLIIETTSPATSHIGFDDIIIIGSGKVTIVDNYTNIASYEVEPRTNFSINTTKLHRATIFANEVSIYAGNFHCTYPMMVRANPIEGIIWPDTTDLEKLNEQIKSTILDWTGGYSSGSGPISSWYKVEDSTLYE